MSSILGIVGYRSNNHSAHIEDFVQRPPRPQPIRNCGERREGKGREGKVREGGRGSHRNKVDRLSGENGRDGR